MWRVLPVPGDEHLRRPGPSGSPSSPGDVVALGSPANPGLVESGDGIEMHYEGIGTLRNTVGAPGDD